MFCNSQIPGERDPDRVDCREYSTPENRYECPYTESNIKLRYMGNNPQLHIPDPHTEGLHACMDFVPTPEANSRLIAKLSQ